LRGGFGFGLRTSQEMGPRHFQFLVGTVVGAFAGIDHPLEAVEKGGGCGEGVAGGAGRGFEVFFQEDVAGALPELGFDATEAAEAPLVGNERVNEEALAGVGGVMVLVVFGGELGEIFGFFVEHDLGGGEDAVLQGVVAGCGFPFGGARSGRFLRIDAVRGGLFS